MNSTTEESLPWATTKTTTPKAPRKAATASATITVADLDPVPAGESVALAAMPRADLPAIQQHIELQLTSLLAQADSIEVTRIDQVDLMAQARQVRLNIREIRLHVEKKHRELKAYHLEEGRKVDAFKNHFLDLCKVREERLQLAEDFAELETARIEQEKRVARAAELQAFTDGSMPPVDLGKLTDDQWTALLSDAKDLKELRVRRLEKEREAAEEAARIEREAAEKARQAREEEEARIRAENEARRMENERLKAEQAATVKRLEEERARAAEERRIEEERETKRRQADMREREAAEAAHRAERAKLEAEKVAAEQAAKAEADRVRREAEAERAKQQRLIDEANRKAAELEQAAARREAEARMAEAKAKAEAAAAARKAAAAPDREKFEAFAEYVATIASPQASTPNGKDLEGRIDAKLAWLARWIKAETAKL